MDTLANGQKLAISKIERHDFETAKNTLEKYTKKSKRSIKFDHVDNYGGLFGLFSHKVTGEELNKLTTQIQDHMITLNGVDQELFDQIRQIYIALDALDNEYITAILDSISAIKKVNDKTLDNQTDIQKAIKNQEKTINVLKKFKEDIDKLKHITDVDKVWELIEKQSIYLKALQQNSDELSRIAHLKDVDILWNDNTSAKKRLDSLDAFTKRIEKDINDRIQLLWTFKENISKINHINDVDSMWDTIGMHNTKIEKTNKQLSASIAEIESKITKANAHFEEMQKESSDTLRIEFYKKQNDLQIDLDTLKYSQKESIDELTDSVKHEKKLLIEEIESVKCIQRENEKRMIQLSEETMNLFNTQKEKFTVKLKIAYIIAGGAATIAIIHFILSLVGLV